MNAGTMTPAMAKMRPNDVGRRLKPPATGCKPSGLLIDKYFRPRGQRPSINVTFALGRFHPGRQLVPTIKKNMIYQFFFGFKTQKSDNEEELKS
jgi:hypothetical protein